MILDILVIIYGLGIAITFFLLNYVNDNGEIEYTVPIPPISEQAFFILISSMWPILLIGMKISWKKE